MSDEIGEAAKKTANILNLRDIEQLLDDVSIAAVDRIKSNIQNEQHVVTGELLGSVGEYERGPGFRVVGSDKQQAFYLENGRGPVVAPDGKVLAFKPKDSAELIFRKSVGPAEPTHVFERSVLEVAEPMGAAFAAKQKAKLDRL